MRDENAVTRAWVAVAFRATMDRGRGFALHRRTECDGYQVIEL